MLRGIFEVDLYCEDGYLKAWLRDGFGVDGSCEWAVSECESGVFFGFRKILVNFIIVRQFIVCNG